MKEVFLVVVTFSPFLYKHVLLLRSRKVISFVIDNKYSGDADSGFFYYAVLRFENGKAFGIYRSKYGQVKPRQIGSQEVLYITNENDILERRLAKDFFWSFFILLFLFFILKVSGV